MILATVAVLASILPFIFAFMLYRPVPRELADRTLIQTLGAMDSLCRLLSRISSKLFGWHYFKLFRYFSIAAMPAVHQNYPDLEVKDLYFDGVPVRLYKHKSLKDDAPAIVCIHGGGWVLNSIDTDEATHAVPLALNTNAAVISIEYRLAPENPYPAAFDDCLQVTKHVLKNGQDYGIDVHRVAIAGGSSGGNLATTVALKLSEEKADSMPALKLQVLLSQITQVLNLRTPSYLLYENLPIVDRRMMAIYMASYLLQDSRDAVVSAIMENRHISPNVRHSVYKDYFNKENLPDYVRQNPDDEIEDPDDDNFNEDVAKKMDILAVDPFVSPLLAQNLSQLPPAYVLVCEFDVLRDDGLLYVHRLKEAGVDVELSFVKNQPHYFVGKCKYKSFQFTEAQSEWDKIYKFLNKNL